MLLRHGGCPEMTRSIGSYERMRWMSALGAALLTVSLLVAFAAQRGQLPTFQTASAAAGPAPAGSSAPLDPRIASVAARHPGEIVQTIVQFKAGVAAERARWIVTRASGK